MADIFISYSKQDHDQARLLAAFLEAEGYSVWWDTSLLSGENFRKTIMTELGRARAAIVIWTENSINSDWVQSEAGRAHADRKLIPVKTRSLSHREIPPPFDNMHVGSVDERDKILGAVVAQLAKPEAQPSAVSRFAKATKFELLSWFGIVGAVITLTTNLQGALILARWLQRVLDSWIHAIRSFWSFVLFFLPPVAAVDAILLTYVAFAAINLVSCLRTGEAQPADYRRKLSIALAAAAIVLIFMIGMASAFDPADWDKSYFDYIVNHLVAPNIQVALVFWFMLSAFWSALVYNPLKEPSISRLRTWFVLSVGVWIVVGMVSAARSDVAKTILGFPWLFSLPLLPVVVLYLAIRAVTPLRLNPAATTTRLWRIVVGMFLVMGLNAAYLWIEQQSWFTRLIG